MLVTAAIQLTVIPCMFAAAGPAKCNVYQFYTHKTPAQVLSLRSPASTSLLFSSLRPSLLLAPSRSRSSLLRPFLPRAITRANH